MADAQGRKRRNPISGQFAARPIKMIESPGFRVLSRAARMALDRIEIEHAHHGGKENGRLPVTYDDLEAFDIHRRTIAPAIRELVALGFVAITEKGAAGNAEFRRPTLYRLTYRPAQGARDDGTHEWKRIETREQAEAIAAKARADADPRAVLAGKKQNPSGSFCRVSVALSATENDQFPVAESATTGPV